MLLLAEEDSKGVHLNVVVEAQRFVTVLLQNRHGMVGGKVFTLHASSREMVGDGRHELVNHFHVRLARQARLNGITI